LLVVGILVEGVVNIVVTAPSTFVLLRVGPAAFNERL